MRKLVLSLLLFILFIQLINEAEAVLPDPISCWSGDGDLTDTFGDNDLTSIGGAVTTSKDVKVGTGSFNMSVSSTTNLEVNTTSPKINFSVNDWTVSLWYKEVNNNPGHMFVQGNRTDYDALTLGLSGSNDATIISTDGSSWSNVLTSARGIYNNWYMLTLTREGTNITLWVDGSTVVTQTLPANINIISNRVLIGSNYDGNTNFNGSLDEIKVWNQALTPTQVLEDFNGGSGVACANLKPTISFTSPTPSNNSNLSQNFIPINISFTNTSSLSNITFQFLNSTSIINTSVTNSQNPWFLNFTSLSDGTYYLFATGYQSDGQSANTTNITITLNTIPPTNVSSLKKLSSTQNSITWSWTNPSDSDFNDSLIFINGTIEATTTNENFTFNSFKCQAQQVITVHTRDNFGNINTTDINNTASTDNCESLKNGLQLYYEFNDIAGGPYLDSSNNGYTSDAVGVPTKVTGIQGFGLGFDGTADIYINSTLNISKLKSSGFSIQNWVNFDTFNTNGDNIWTTKTDTGTGISLYYNNSATNLVLEMFNESGTVCTSTSGTFNGTTGAWHNFLFSYSADIGAIFVDGSLLFKTDSCPITTFTSQLLINRFDKNSGNGFEIDGTQDEFAVWNRSLTEPDALNLWNGGLGRSYSFISGAGVNSGNILFNIGTPNNVTQSFTYDKTTKIITYTWDDSAQTISGAYFDTIIYNTSGAFSDSRQQSMEVSGTLTYNISSILDNGWSLYAIAYINDSSRVYIFGDQITIAALYIEPTLSLSDVIPEDEGSVLGWLLLSIFVFAGVSSRSTIATIVLTDVGLIATRSFGLLKVSIGFIITAILMSFVILWLIGGTRR